MPRPRSRLALEVRGLSACSGQRPILRDVTLEVAGRGCVIGPNGAGKTTLLHAVAGLVPFEGRVGCGVGERAPRRERARLVALVPQQPAIPEGVTVQDYVLLGRTPHLGVLGSERRSDLVAVGRRSTDSTSGGRRSEGWTRSREASCNGWCSPARSRRRRRCCSSTSRRPGWISGIRSGPRARGRAPSRERPDGPVDDARPDARGPLRRPVRAAVEGATRRRGLPRRRARRRRDPGALRCECPGDRRR